MAQERQPVTTLQTQKSTLETQKTAFGTFLSKLSALESAIDKLGTTASINPTKAVSSSTNVEVSAGSSAPRAPITSSCRTLARAHVVATSGLSPYASADTVVATSGTLDDHADDRRPSRYRGHRFDDDHRAGCGNQCRVRLAGQRRGGADLPRPVSAGADQQEHRRGQYLYRQQLARRRSGPTEHRDRSVGAQCLLHGERSGCPERVEHRHRSGPRRHADAQEAGRRRDGVDHRQPRCRRRRQPRQFAS